ncbi:MAG TPA: cell division protein FtsA [Salinisphaeraceae bacterium]|nr:cell division protein FtsA [Salinisphaeraceae bacterium]
MSKRPENSLIVALDIGTSKVACIVAEPGTEGELEIIGLGSAPSRGMKKGMVVNIESTTDSIRRAVEEAELMAGCRIQSVYCGISGAHVQSHNSPGIVAVRNREVSESDIERVVDAACAVRLPSDHKILHVLPQEFSVDDNEGIQEPVGMSGVRLEARVHIVTGSVTSAQNIQKCVARCGLEVAKLSLEQLASSYAVLSQDEKDLGVALVDIGGGTSDIAVFVNGAIRHTAVIPIAGDQVTNDIAVALRTPTQHAEQIKIRYGCALPDLIEHDDAIEVPSVGDRPPRQLSRSTLAEVIKPRYEELFVLIHKELVRSGFDELLAGGIVITGGSSKMEGVIDLAEEVFHKSVRQGVPQRIKGMTDVVKNPIHATGVGLLQFAGRTQPRGSEPGHRDNSFAQVWERMKAWFKGNF